MNIFKWGKKKVSKIPEIDFGKGKFLSTKTYGNDRFQSKPYENQLKTIDLNQKQKKTK